MDVNVLSALIGLGGALMGAYAGFRGSKSATEMSIKIWQRERDEKYRDLTFETRLQKHQEAFRTVHQLQSALSSINFLKDENCARECVFAEAKAARKWWDKNCLYLDEQSRSDLLTAINMAGNYLIRKEEKMTQPVWNQFDKTVDSILSGIGKKHLSAEAKEMIRSRPEK